MHKTLILDFYGVLVNGGTVNQELVDLLGELKKKGIKLFLFSAADEQQIKEHAANYPFLAVFDKLYYTGEIGFDKAEPDAYQLILDKQGLVAEECLYFDDSPANVVAAREVGIDAYVFENAAQVQAKSGI
jgi:HAD superfamily hydrolase (TIGR01509 family)